MDEIFTPAEKRPFINPVFIGGVLVALVIVGIAIYLLSFRPPMEEQTAQILAGAVREGDPGFADLSKDIIIWTDENKTVESPTGLGTISMFIAGKIRNKGEHTITVLEVNVAIVTQMNDILREKRVLVVPIQQSSLGPGEVITITLTHDGFQPRDDRANIRWRVTAIKTADQDPG